MPSKIKDEKSKWLALKNSIAQLDNTVVFVGIQEEDMKKPKETLDGKPSTATLGEVAVYNEFGTENIPARSFIRAPWDSTNGYEKLRDSLLKRTVEGKISVVSALNILGSSIAKSFIKRIKDGIEPENSESTLAKKELYSDSQTTLIATGQLVENIAYKIEK